MDQKNQMMSKQSFSIKFYLNPAKEIGGKLPIYVRITINRKKAEINTQEYSSPKKWDESKQRVKGDPELNAHLTLIENDLRSIYRNLLIDGDEPTAKLIKEYYNGKDKSKMKLLFYYDQVLADMINLPDYTEATVKKYKTIRKHLGSFLGAQGKSTIKLTDFEKSDVYELEVFLKTKSKLNVNTTSKYLKQLKAIFNRALQFGHIKSNPFEGYKLKWEKVNRPFLTQEEVNAINEFDSDNDSLMRVRDLFMFAVYTGLRFTDVSKLTPKNIRVDGTGRSWIHIEQQKTGDALQIPVLDRANVIIERYSEEAQITGKLLPMRSNQKINAYLKVVADLCGIDKKLTYHVARHTFATTITLSKGIPVELVSKMLGHRDLSTTQIYAKINSEYLASTADKLNKML